MMGIIFWLQRISLCKGAFFFSGEGVVYPITPVELRERIIKDALTGPQKIPYRFFDLHFNDGGGQIHPLLGDLAVLATEINTQWHVQPDAGLNLVAGSILNRLGLPQQLPLQQELGALSMAAT